MTVLADVAVPFAGFTAARTPPRTAAKVSRLFAAVPVAHVAVTHCAWPSSLPSRSQESSVAVFAERLVLTLPLDGRPERCLPQRPVVSGLWACSPCPPNSAVALTTTAGAIDLLRPDTTVNAAIELVGVTLPFEDRSQQWRTCRTPLSVLVDLFLGRKIASTYSVAPATLGNDRRCGFSPFGLSAPTLPISSFVSHFSPKGVMYVVPFGIHILDSLTRESVLRSESMPTHHSSPASPPANRRDLCGPAIRPHAARFAR